MTINIKATNTELTPAISSYVEEKINSLDKFISVDDPSSVLANVEIGLNTKHHQSGKIYRAEINLHIAGKYIRVVSEQEDLYVAIDDAKDKVIREITNEKEKSRSLLRRGEAKVKNFLKGFKNKK